ncbi:hypothetical protein BJJ90_18060 [Escherichia coli]|nr:hypothetical protein BJJ90_18060 [Escherichia coli]
MACQQKPEPDSGFVKLSGYFIPPIFSHVPSARRICSGLTTHCICFLSEPPRESWRLNSLRKR